MTQSLHAFIKVIDFTWQFCLYWIAESQVKSSKLESIHKTSADPHFIQTSQFFLFLSQNIVLIVWIFGICPQQVAS